MPAAEPNDRATECVRHSFALAELGVHLAFFVTYVIRATEMISKNAVNRLYRVLLLVGFGALASAYHSGVWAQLLDENLPQHESGELKVQYHLAKLGGSPEQLCHLSESVASTYLDTEDMANYKKWKTIASADCLQEEPVTQ